MISNQSEANINTNETFQIIQGNPMEAEILVAEFQPQQTHKIKSPKRKNRSRNIIVSSPHKYDPEIDGMPQPPALGNKRISSIFRKNKPRKAENSPNKNVNFQVSFEKEAQSSDEEEEEGSLSDHPSTRSLSHCREQGSHYAITDLDEPIEAGLFIYPSDEAGSANEKDSDKNSSHHPDNTESQAANLPPNPNKPQRTSTRNIQNPQNAEKSLFVFSCTYESAHFIFRCFYFLILMYTGFIFPIISSLRHYLLIPVQLLFNVCQLVYITAKIKAQYTNKGLWLGFRKYLGTMESIELLGLVPFELWVQSFFEVLYFLKLFRLITFTKQFRTLFINWLSKKQVSFWNTILILQIVTLWKANVWIFFSNSSYNQDGWTSVYCSKQPSQVVGDSVCFLKAYYLILYTCITVGYGDLPPIVFRQRVLMLYFMLDGLLVLSYCIAGISSYLQEQIISKTDRQKGEYYLGQIRKDLGQSCDGLNEAYRYLMRQSQVHMENEENFEVVQQLPESVRGNISRELNKKVFGSISFFKKFHLIDLVDVLPLMVELHYAKGDLITKEGVPGEDIYLLRSGEAAALMPSNYEFKKKICFLRFLEKCSFGQYEAFPHSRPYRFSVVALEDCRVLVISAYQLLPFFLKNEKVYQELLEYAAVKGREMQESEKQAANEYVSRETEIIEMSYKQNDLRNDDASAISSQQRVDAKIEEADEIQQTLGQMDVLQLKELLVHVKKCKQLLNYQHSPVRLQRKRAGTVQPVKKISLYPDTFVESPKKREKQLLSCRCLLN